MLSFAICLFWKVIENLSLLGKVLVCFLKLFQTVIFSCSDSKYLVLKCLSWFDLVLFSDHSISYHNVIGYLQLNYVILYFAEQLVAFWFIAQLNQGRYKPWTQHCNSTTMS